MGMDEKKMVYWLHDVCELREQVRVIGVGRRGPRDCLRTRAARECHAEPHAHALTAAMGPCDCTGGQEGDRGARREGHEDGGDLRPLHLDPTGHDPWSRWCQTVNIKAQIFREQSVSCHQCCTAIAIALCERDLKFETRCHAHPSARAVTLSGCVRHQAERASANVLQRVGRPSKSMYKCGIIQGLYAFWCIQYPMARNPIVFKSSRKKCVAHHDKVLKPIAGFAQNQSPIPTNNASPHSSTSNGMRQ